MWWLVDQTCCYQEPHIGHDNWILKMEDSNVQCAANIVQVFNSLIWRSKRTEVELKVRGNNSRLKEYQYDCEIR